MCNKPLKVIIYTFFLQLSVQNCPEEISKTGIRVTWPRSPPRTNVESNPVCYHNETIVRRYCNDTEWVPPLPDLEPCLKVVEHFDTSSCPPGFHKISENNNDYCYHISETSAWNFPCFKSGGASVITDLSAEEIDSLLKSLNNMNISRYYWLPAQRQKMFNPAVWYIPGPNWGRLIYSSTNLRVQTSILKNCLILDIEQRLITTETCNKEYPSLCFYLNDIFYPAECPDGYHAFRFKADNGICYGIELSDDANGLTFEDFLRTKCLKPMGDSQYTLSNNYLNRFLFVKIAELYQLSDHAWCWYETTNFARQSRNQSSSIIFDDSDTNVTYIENSSFEGVINSQGSVSLINMLSHLPCMACEAEIVYKETLMTLEYNTVETKLYLTVYFPSGLWKYDDDDKGIQCFSDAKGFVKVVDVINIPFLEVEEAFQKDQDSISTNVEKVVYIVDLITQRSAQYWCEGHTNEFSLVTTNKIIATAPGNKLHVFALVLKINISNNDDASPDNIEYISSFISNMTSVFEAEKVLLMDIFEYTLDYMLVLVHLHVTVHEIYEDKSSNLIVTYNTLKEKSETKLLDYNITFLNISSSMYCLPSTTIDAENDVVLDWELTEIGHIASARQFCLQDNGLPVTRRCGGSYLVGGNWEQINGICNKNLSPSTTTKFLYNFVQERTVFKNFSSRFLTDGLRFVLNDIEIIIPADIYYLAISLQQVSNIAYDNQSSIDIGDITNIAWVMDRILDLNDGYLRLAQSLNSTNVILDSINKFIEMLARKNKNSNFKEDTYQLSVQPQFILQISYPEFNNISGMALVRSTESDKFTDMVIRPLYKNSTVEDVLTIENLEIATWLPTHVLDAIKKLTNNSFDENCLNKEDIHIVVNIYHNHAIFQELDDTKHRINSRIVGLSVPGFISNLEHSVPLVFKEINTTNFNKFCGYWNFNTNKVGKNPGYWTNDGCYYVKTIEHMTICKCYHMTHFGQLIDIGTIVDPEKNYINKNHSKALNIITLIGSFLSLFGVAGIWITASVFQTWRKKAGTKVLLQLSTAISLPLILIIIFNLDNSIFVEYDGKYVVAEHMTIICVILGALLHYSILTSFVWMLITAILQFIRYVRVLGVCRPSRFMIKFTIIGWGLPLIPVILTLALDYENYISNSSSDSADIDKGPICYPNGIYFIAGVLLPIAIILLINVILFALVIHAISRGPDGKMRPTDIDLVGSQLRLSIFLFFLIGLTWFFGIFSFTGNLLFSYLFCLTSTMQGFVLFIYFVICDPSTRNLWITLMKPQFSTSSSGNSVSSISSS